ncbi:DUF2059 domain-containing protein [Pseudorhodobacter sp. W20_MBD10_FR17]|uniref:DUF2059 domain-containing protein n=1 Tax=Pseudorhodobacter sp. W20_MBD10_FR17 TaxID=3240266 RepID=UPI003F9C31BD
MNARVNLLAIFLSAVLGCGSSLGAADAKPAYLVQAQTRSISTVVDLVKTLKIAEVIDVMRLEGLRYGASMEDELFSGNGGAGWARAVEIIYDGPTMQARFNQAFAAALKGADADLAAMDGFFATELGQRILSLEIEARRSLMDEAAEDAAKARAEEMMAEAAPRIEALQAFSEANDLIELNIAGAMNANLAFFQGLSEVEGGTGGMPEEDMLADVWGQEPDIRAETEAWVLPYLALAYGPLSDDELASYIGFSKTGPGQKLNHALFSAFDVVFSQISRDLGRAAAKQMMGEDI